MNTENLGNPDESKEFADTYEHNLTVGSNDTIRKEIYEAIGDKSGVDVHVNNGIVIITGAISGDEQRNSIEDAIKNIPGVHEVINELTFKKVS